MSILEITYAILSLASIISVVWLANAMKRCGIDAGFVSSNGQNELLKIFIGISRVPDTRVIWMVWISRVLIGTNLTVLLVLMN